MKLDTIICGDCLEVMRGWPDGCVQTCVTSPPYWGLRDYGVDGQLGLEATLDEYVTRMVGVFREVRRVLRDDGTLWLNLGDRWLPNKQLVGLPWRVAFALQADGWLLRSEVIWNKPNAKPESATDRPTLAHETLFLLAVSGRYVFDSESIKERGIATDLHGQTGGGMPTCPPGQRPQSGNRKKTKVPSGWDTKPGAHGTIHREGRTQVPEYRELPAVGIRNKRSVWTVATHPYPDAHFATFPPKLITPCILAGAPEGGVVLDPFIGSGTTAVVAHSLGRRYIGVELNPEYVAIAEQRLAQRSLLAELT